MEKRKIVVKIIAKENPYNYNGESILNKDLLIFDDKEYHNIFDFKTKRLIREKKGLRLLIDYEKQEISLNSDNANLNFNFEVKKKKVSIIDVDISYKIKCDSIRLIIKEV